MYAIVTFDYRTSYGVPVGKLSALLDLLKDFDSTKSEYLAEGRYKYFKSEKLLPSVDLINYKPEERAEAEDA